MSMERNPAVYILASQKRGTLYIGVTSMPLQRMVQHREERTGGFTAQHGVKRLVHVEWFEDMPNAIAREKQLKNWRRAWKIALIEKDNPGWRDLALDWGLEPLSPPRHSRMGPGSSPG
jgi:putative endonuclease